ncbi:MAG: carboxypeptidase-like regulatory domain-containing protein, partial [Candidatus Dojkabacteria bacterium]|nr:carboxypeptidase-like regulatory domain-containing protein [Candidatus Dojkabacteria bacterium]
SVSGVYIESKGEILKLGLDATSSFYKTRMDIFNSLGTYDLNILAMFDDNTTARMKLEVLVDPYGFVYEDVKGQELRLSNAKVTLYSKLDNKWNIYGTGNNPQFTNKHGEYQFMVEPGTYKIEVELDGYDKYESEEIEVEKTTIEKNIQLQKGKIEYIKYAYILGGIFLLIGIIVLSRKKK